MKFEIVKMKAIWFFLFALLTLSVTAQERSITGKVTDATTNEGLIGVTVLIEGTYTGTVTDIDGKFSVKVTPGAKLVFSFIGYQAQTLAVGTQSTLNVALKTEAKGLDEVVVIGYGTVKKSDATGSISTVSSKDFNKGAMTSAQDLIVGKSAGVVITSDGGAPGSGSTIRIRGGSSLNASNDPLIIIDGVPIANSNVSGSSNFLSFVNPNDIETFTVLKDASSTAIYGSRASNGVILITTKSGTLGSPLHITYNGNASIGEAVKYVDVYSGDQLRQIAADHVGLFGADSFNKLGSANTNWQKEIFRTAVSSDHNLSLSGATKNLPYRVSVGFTDQNGILKNTGMQRFTGSVNLNPVLLEGALKLNINAKGMTTDQNFADAGAVGSAVGMDPTHPVYDNSAIGVANSAGYFQWNNYGANLGTPNPVEQLMMSDNKSTVQRAIANVQANYKLPFLPDLKANLNLATDYTDGKGHNNRPVTSPSTLTSPLNGKLSDYTGTNYNNLLDFYLNYNKELGSHKIDATAGYSWQHFKRDGHSYTRGIVDAGHAYSKTDSTSFITENYLVSFFGRVNYTFKNRYLLTATIRDDGSSRFAKNNQWGLFPSAAFAWKIKEESFLKNVNAVSDMKLRLGWGVTGQQDVGNDYPAQARYIKSVEGSYYPIGGSYLPTLRPNAYDPNIKWEETTTSNIGFDFGLLKDRITGSVDVYNRVTTNLLNTVTIPSGSNFSNTLLTNVGSLENKGIEASLNLTAISKKDMSLTFGFNFTYNENKITKLLISDDPNYIGILYGSAFTGTNQVTRVGYGAYSYFLNKQVYDTNGNPIEGVYVDLSGKGGTVSGNNADKYIYKNPTPKYLLGFSARFNYKAFDFSASARTNIGNYVYNQVAASASYDQMYAIGYWKNEPTYLTDTKFVKRQFTSDYFVENASFFKLDNVSAGYNFDNLYDHFKVRLSLTVQNALTITKYKGIDPEVSGGIDNNFYPRPRTFMLGVSITY